MAGVDSSTQSVKVVLCRAVDGTAVERYSAPHPDGTECHPQHWEEALAGAAPANLARAAVEGMLAGLADAVDAHRGQGVEVSSVRLIGGGTPDHPRRPRGAGVGAARPHRRLAR